MDMSNFRDEITAWDGVDVAEVAGSTNYPALMPAVDAWYTRTGVQPMKEQVAKVVMYRANQQRMIVERDATVQELRDQLKDTVTKQQHDEVVVVLERQLADKETIIAELRQANETQMGRLDALRIRYDEFEKRVILATWQYEGRGCDEGAIEFLEDACGIDRDTIDQVTAPDLPSTVTITFDVAPDWSELDVDSRTVDSYVSAFKSAIENEVDGMSEVAGSSTGGFRITADGEELYG